MQLTDWISGPIHKIPYPFDENQFDPLEEFSRLLDCQLGAVFVKRDMGVYD
jgi:hypothetical protein